MEGSVLSFLKAEWNVSDTGSAHWASSFFYYITILFIYLFTERDLAVTLNLWNRNLPQNYNKPTKVLNKING